LTKYHFRGIFCFMKKSATSNAEYFISTRHGFHEHVLNVRQNDPNILDKKQEITDINVSGIYNPYEFSGFGEIESAYDMLLGQLDMDEPDSNLIKEKITADQAMLSILQGQEMEFADFVKATMGFTPEKIDDRQIELLELELGQLLELLGHAYDEEGVKSYLKSNELKDSDEIEKQFKRSIYLARLAMWRYLEVPKEDMPLQFVVLPNAPWSGYMSSDQQGNLAAQINTDPSRRYTKQKILGLMFHEYAGHFYQFNSWKKSIETGEMSPAAGLTSVSSPETIQNELVATFAESCSLNIQAPESERIKAEIDLKYSRLFNAASNNAIMDINSGMPEDVVIDYMQSHLLFETKDRLSVLIKACRDYPTYRSGFMAYHKADELLGSLTTKNEEERGKVIKPIYQKALTADRLQSLLDNL
jgi:hypothetical protein